MAEKVVLHPVHPPGLAELIGSEPGVDVVRPESHEDVVVALQAEAPVLVTFAWDDDFITGDLRWVQSLTAGMEQFPLDALREASIVLTSARGVHAPAVAEHAIALLMASVRNIGGAMRDVPTRGWVWGRPAFEIGGRTLGVIGLGHVGEHVARLAAGLGMRVIGTKAHPEGYAGIAERVLGPDGALEVCAEADVVVVAVPAGAAAGPVIGREALEQLGAGWLVNVGRGSAVDEQALVDALTSGELRGAGLDVFETEPLPADSLLWELPTVVITPHTAWASDRLPERMAERFLTNLTAFRGEREWLDRWV